MPYKLYVSPHVYVAFTLNLLHSSANRDMQDATSHTERKKHLEREVHEVSCCVYSQGNVANAILIINYAHF